MPHEKIKAARKKLERRRRRKEAKRRARARRIRRGEPKGVREKAAVTKKEAGKLKDELSKNVGSSTKSAKSAASTADSAIDRMFGPTGDSDDAERLFGRDDSEGDSPLFKEQNVDDDPLFGAPGEGGDTGRVDLGFGAESMDEGASEDVDPMFGPGRGEREDQDLFSGDREDEESRDLFKI